MAKAELISNRELARRLNLTEGAVRKARADGRLKKCINKDGKIIASKAIAEAQQNMLGLSNNTQKRYVSKPATRQQPTQLEPDNSGPVSYNEARTKAAILDVNLKALKYKTLKNQLVNKSDVYASLYDYGVKIKTRLLAIPDRITDELISIADNRNEFYKLLSTTITDALEILSKEPEIKQASDE